MAIRTSAIDVIIRMRGQRAFAGQVKKTAAELEAMGVKGASALGKVAIAGQKMQAFGATMTRRFTAPVALGIGLAAKSAIDFNQRMEQVATQAGASQKEVEKMSKALVDFSTSGQTEFGPEDLATGLYHVESLGYRGAKAMDIMKASSEGAAVGNSDLEDTTRVLAHTMHAFGIPAQDAVKTMSQFNSIVGHGDMTMSEFVTAMQTGVVPVFKLANLKLSDLGGALDTLTSNQFNAAKAGTGLKMAIAAILSPSDKAAGIMKGLGVDVTTLQTKLQKQGLVPALEYLQKSIEASGQSATEVAPQLLAAFGGGRTGPAILTLIQHLDELKQKVGTATPDISKFDRAVAHWAETPAAKLEKAKAQIEGVGVAIGQTVAPVLGQVADDLGDVVKWFDALPAPVKSALGYIVAIGAALGPIVWAVGTILKTAKGIMEVMKFIAGLTIAEDVGAAGAGLAAGAGATAGATATAEAVAAGTAGVPAGEVLGGAGAEAAGTGIGTTLAEAAGPAFVAGFAAYMISKHGLDIGASGEDLASTMTKTINVADFQGQQFRKLVTGMKDGYGSLQKSAKYATDDQIKRWINIARQAKISGEITQAQLLKIKVGLKGPNQGLLDMGKALTDNATDAQKLANQLAKIPANGVGSVDLPNLKPNYPTPGAGKPTPAGHQDSGRGRGGRGGRGGNPQTGGPRPKTIIEHHSHIYIGRKKVAEAVTQAAADAAARS